MKTTKNEIDQMGFGLLVAGVGSTTYLECAWLFGQAVPAGTAVLWLGFFLLGLLYSLLTDPYAPIPVLMVRLAWLGVFVAVLAALLALGVPGLSPSTYVALWAWRWIDLVLMAVGLVDDFSWKRPWT